MRQVMEFNQIICEDNVSLLSDFPSEVIDLTVTSPPYGQLRDYDGYELDFQTLVQQLYRVTKQGGVVVWVVGDETINGSETGESFRQALYFKEIGFNLHDTMIYAKKGFANPSNNRYHQTFEYMFVFSKGKPKTFNPIRDRKNRWICGWGDNTHRQKDGSLRSGSRTTRRKDGTFRVHKNYERNEFGRRYNIWNYVIGGGNCSRDEIAYQHPAIFPEQLAADHIISWSNEGDLVLDPMCGSGTTCKMAKELNRKYIGIDISAEYCKLTMKRLSWDDDVQELAASLSQEDFLDVL